MCGSEFRAFFKLAFYFVAYSFNSEDDNSTRLSILYII